MPVIIHTIEARTHGRYLVDRPAAPGLAPMLVGLHGYGESAEQMLANLRAVARPSPEATKTMHDWCLVSVQALHRYYTRKQDVVASWMTRQDRELEIADNIEYVWSVVRAAERDHQVRRPLVFAGFSQGVAMAYRAAVAGDCDGLIVLAGDVPPDVAPRASTLPPILLGRGTADEWYTAAKAAADREVLGRAGARVSEHVFEGGHTWDPTFVARARLFLKTLLAQ